MRVRLIRLELEWAVTRVAVGNPRGTPQEHERCAFVGLARVVEIGAYDHVVIAIAIDVPSSRHAVTQPRVRLVRLELGMGGTRVAVGNPRGTPQEDERRAFVGLARVVAIGATITSS